MFGRDSKRPAAVDILIGKTARVRGDIDFAGGLHLDGQVTGNVRADPARASTLSVSETGLIEGSARAADVILNGTVRGDILASGRVILGPRAKVHGDVHYGVIETALGAEILGRLMPLGERNGSGQGTEAATTATAADGHAPAGGAAATATNPAGRAGAVASAPAGASGAAGAPVKPAGPAGPAGPRKTA